MDLCRLIITDLDNTLTGDDQSLQAFVELIKKNDHIGFGIATGRRLDSSMSLMDELGLPRPDLIDTDCPEQDDGPAAVAIGARTRASKVEGLYCPVSIELIVWRVTPARPSI